MRWEAMALFVLLLSLLLLPSCYSLPMCTDQTHPKTLNSSLEFCGYSGKACCSGDDDLAISNVFTNMNISDASCANVIKSILCAQCSPYAFDLYTKSQSYPVLCNSNLVVSSPPNNSTTDFCTQTWNSCKDISIRSSPFANGTSNSPNKLSDNYKGATDFCGAVGSGATDKNICFNGGVSVGFNGTVSTPTPQGICLERLFNGSFTNMAPHPDGSNKIFVGTQSGKIFLATVPPQGSGKTLDIDLTNPFIDLTDVVHYDNEFGLNSFTFHPNFTTNGRFFVAYNCDKSKSTTCSGRCSCNSEINCDPSKLGTTAGALPCQYQAVIAEYTVNGTVSPNMATNANPAEIVRIFTMGLPYTTHHAGQLFFGPTDGYLYFSMGDGGNKGDPWNFAQNKKSMLGKLLRFNVDAWPTNAMIDNLTLWGNYSIPNDNPYFTDNTFRPEVYSLGLRNPWRCNYDTDRPTYLFCGETSEDTYEEINLMQKGGNYGWRIYQGYDPYFPPWAPGPNISANSIDPIFPVVGYNRSEVNNDLGSAAIVAGYVYRGKTDPCLYGRYIFGDLYANDMFMAVETPLDSGNFTRERVNFTCTKNSPILCDFAKSTVPSLGYIFSFGQDNNKDLFYLTSKGVYRVVRPSLCGYSCPLDTNSTAPGSAPSSKNGSSKLALGLKTPAGLVLTCLLILLSLKF